jgi:hypothetical protein
MTCPPKAPLAPAGIHKLSATDRKTVGSISSRSREWRMDRPGGGGSDSEFGEGLEGMAKGKAVSGRAWLAEFEFDPER